MQRRKLCPNPNVPDHLNLLLVPGRRGPLLQSRLGLRDAQGMS